MLVIVMNTLTFLVLGAWLGTLLGLTLVFLIRVAKLVEHELYK